MQKTDICMCVCACRSGLLFSYGLNPSCTHTVCPSYRVSCQHLARGERRAYSALAINFLPCLCVCICKISGVWRPSALPPWVPVIVQKAEQCVQQAAARRKSLLLLLQTGSCLPETRRWFLEKSGERLMCREGETEVQGENSM